jgi:PAS domain S-box-containing protein
MEQVSNFFYKLFDTADFPARWYCGRWSDFHGWLFIISDILIGIAYFAIPVALYFFIKRQGNTSNPFNKTLRYFVLFIMCCGLTHFVDALIFWVPVYRFAALLLFITALVSIATVIVLLDAIPKTLKMRTPEQMQAIIDEKTAALAAKTAELEQSNLKLRDSEAQFRLLVESNPDVIARIDSYGRYQFVNSAIEQSTGRSKEDFYGKDLYELDYELSYIREFYSHLQKSLRENQPQRYRTESWDLGSPVDAFDVLFIPMPAVDEAQEDTVLMVARDVSRERLAEERLRSHLRDLKQVTERLMHQNHQLEEFSYITAHNLRSHVKNIISFLDLMEYEDDEKEREMVIEKVRKTSWSLSQTIEDLSEVVKIRKDTNKKRDDLNFEELTERVIQGLLSDVERYKVKIVTNFEACPNILYPKVYLESILHNLISNAIKYRQSEVEPIVSLRTRSYKEYVELIVADNGQGIDMDKFGHKLFGLYQTFHGNKDARGEGLYMVKNQVEALGGYIRVESKLKVGTTFHIFLSRTDKPIFRYSEVDEAAD